MTILDANGKPTTEIADECDHGIVFDAQAAKHLSPHEVRRRWPRLFGNCPKGCGFSGIGYASFEHYISGDW